MELKKELLEFLEANNNFGLIEGLVEGIVDTYISAYKQDDKPLNEKKKSPQSSVEWLVEQLRMQDQIIEQAKDLHHEELSRLQAETYHRGFKDGKEQSFQQPKYDLHELAEEWVFVINGHKWSNNDDTAGDNYGSFIQGFLQALELFNPKSE